MTEEFKPLPYIDYLNWEDLRLDVVQRLKNHSINTITFYDLSKRFRENYIKQHKDIKDVSQYTITLLVHKDVSSNLVGPIVINEPTREPKIKADSIRFPRARK